MTLAEKIEELIKYHAASQIFLCAEKDMDKVFASIKDLSQLLADKLVVDKKSLEDIISDNTECGVMIYGISSLVNDIIKSKRLIKIKE